MNRLRETAFFEEGSRKKIWALLGAYALVALTVVSGTSKQQALAATWATQSTPTTEHLEDVDFPVNDQTGWAVGTNATVLHTSDGGTVWSAQSVPTAQDLFGVDFVDNLTGWAVGSNGTVLKSTDGGGSWVAQTSPLSVLLNSVHFPADASTGYAVGGNGTILKTTDGGTNWVAQSTPTTSELTRVYFPLDATTGYVVAQGGTILKTANGGSTWVSQPNPTGQNLTGVHFPVDTATGWVSGRGPTILRTIDGGANWTSQTSPVAEQLNDLYMFDTLNGVIVGNNGTILETTDGGANWTSDGPVTGEHLNSVHWPSASTGFAVGNTGTIVRATGDVSVSGTIFEDIAGDALSAGSIGDAANPAAAGVTVHLYRDDGDGVPDAADTSLGSDITDASGAYSFSALDAGESYWVVADSSTVPAAGGYNSTYGAADAVPEQTYGPAGSLCADPAAWSTTTSSGATGTCYGGREVSTADTSGSDNLGTWYSGSEHLALIDLSSGSITNADFGFSFNVVVGRNSGVGVSAEQGSFDRFLQNANAIAGANQMHFVPSGPTNAAAVGADWWLLAPSGALTPINDADTAVDGTAFNSAGAVRNDNPGAVGTGGTVGVDAIALAQVPGSELQIDGQGLVVADDGVAGLVPHRATIRALSITEAGAQAIRVNAISQAAPVADDIVLEDLIIGMPPVWQPQTLPTGTSTGIHLNATNRAVLRDSFIGWTNGRTLNVETSTNATITGSEFRDTSEDVIDLYESSSGTLFERNRVSGGLNWAIDITVTSNITLRNNTIDSAGDGVGQTGGVRLYGPGSTIDRNIFSNNSGPAIAIAGTMTSPARPLGEAVITGNHFVNNDGLSIDLQPASEDNLLSGDGITPNDGGGLDATHGNRELDFPVITGAGLSGATTTVSGTACSGCTVEIYRAVGGTGDDDPPGSGTNYHGEGIAYLGTGVATGGAFSIDVTGPIAGDAVSATATDTGLGVTSEFGLNSTVVAVNGPPVFDQDLGNRTAGEGQAVSLPSPATDPDGDPLSYSATGLPPGLSINTSSGLISGTIAPESEGAYAVTITVDDLISGTDVDTFTWTVTKGMALISDIPATSNDLLTWFNPDDPSPVTNEADIGTGTGTTVIKGMDAKPGSGTLYATAGGQLGTVDGVIGIWSAVGTLGSGDGAFGTVSMNDVNALSFHPITGVLYAVQNRPGDTDFLFTVDPSTGALVPDAFGAGIDYVEIGNIGARNEVQGLAIHPTTGVAYIGTGDDGDSTSQRIATLNLIDGSTSGIGDTDPPIILGLAFTADGQLVGVGFDDAAPAEQYVYDIDVTDASTSNPRRVDNGETYQAIAAPLPLTAGIYGSVFEDSTGDALAGGSQLIGDAANPMAAGVTVRLYRDDGSTAGEPDATDSFVTSTVTDPDGLYEFKGIANDDYWVVVDSTTVVPAGGLNAPYTQADVWAEQTYGPARSVGFDGISTYSFTGARGPFYGGKQPTASDDAGTLPGAEHIASVILAGTAIVNTDFGFSFNVLTSTRGSTTAQDPGAGGGLRTVQGSLRQFLTNANGIAGSNIMRFVPSAPVNDGTWWEILVTDALPAIDDELTQMDGTAYEVADGVTVRDTNPGYLGANAAGGLTVGVDGLALTQVERPELEIQGDQAAALPPQFGLEILASQTTVRELALRGFGDTLTAGLDSDIRVGPSVTPLEGIVLDRLVIGSAPDTFADPGVATRSQGTGIRISDAVSGGGILDNVISDSLVGFVRSTGVLVNNDTGGWIVSGNEIRNVGTDPFSGRPDGLSVEGGGSTSHTIIGNLIAGSSRVGIETWRSDGGHSIVNNDVLNSSVGQIDETAGIRLAGSGTTVEKNRITGGDGPGIIVLGENTASPHVASVDNRISQNEFGTNTGLAIDLVAATTVSAPHSTGDGLTLTAGTDAGTGNNGLDAPAITAATSASVAGTACATCRVELYRAVSGAGDGGYGEGLEFLGFDVADGSGNWAVSGVTAALVGQEVSSIAIDVSNDTSEFGLNVTVVASNTAPVADPIVDQTVDEMTLLSLTATAVDTDVPADTLTWTQDSGPGSVLANGDYSWTPTEAQGPGTYTVVLRVTDDGTGNLDDTVSFDVTVNEVNLAPVLDPVGDRTVDELVSLGFTATASDPDDPANLLVFSLSGAPAGASITAGGVFSWTPTEVQGPGSYVFDVVVTEADGSPTNLIDSETITVTVGEVNVAPVLDAVGDRSVDELTALSFVASASDPDDPANLLSFSLSGAPAGASITAGGVFSWTPTEAQGPGSYVFDVVVTETNGSPSNLSDSESITVTVGEVNLAPVLDPVGDRTVDELVSLGFTATASDPDDPANLLVFSLSGAPAGASITAGGVFSWTPTEAQGPGVFSFDVVVTETDGSPSNLADSETITVTVGEVNVAPVADAIADTAVDELATLALTATGSDADVPANTLAWSLDSGPGFILPNGNYTWTPTEAQGPGIYTVTLRVSDSGTPSLSDTVSFDVTVGEVNLAPVLDAVGDRVVDELVNLSFAASASDPDDPANLLVFSLSGAPAGASITAGGVFSWTPTEAQGPGSYVFDVVVTETNGSPSNLSDSETITVTVGEVNLVPTLDPVGDRSVDELTALSFTATASDPDDPANLLVFSLSGAPAGASITAGGVFSWTPTEAQGPGSYVFDVVVTETNGSPTNLSDSESITVTVSEGNLPPVLDGVGDRSVDELVNLSFTATASDPDDPANLLSFSLSGAPSGASITAGGVFSWTPTEAQGPGSYVFDVVVTETNGSPSNLSDSESITVTVGEVNLAPVLNFVGNRAVDELVNLSFAASASDPDDPANLLAFSLSGAPAGASITAGGVLSWTPTEAQGPGVFSFDVVVTETNGSPSNLSDSETITVTVGEDNLAPTLNPVGNQTINELVNLSFTATASDPDAPVNTLLFSLAGEPAGAIIDPNTGAFSWTPTETQGPGSYVFDVIVADDGVPGLNDSETITVTVNEVNLAPVLDPVGDRSVDELVNLPFTATASDPDDPANTLTFSLSGAPAGASITAGGVFSWTPTEAQGPGSYVFDVVVTETNGTPTNQADSETITITINEANLAPSLDPVGDRSVAELSALSFTATASDPDDPANLLVFSLVGAPPGASITAGGVFSWTPTEAQGPGSYVFDVVVTETNGSPTNLSDSEAITVTVSEGNLAPVLDPVGDRNIDELVNLSFSATASDPDDPANLLAFSLSGAPAGASVTAGGVFSWTPTEAQGPGSYVFDVVVTETDGSPSNLSDSETITVTVGEVNLAPVPVPMTNRTVSEYVVLNLTASATDPDTPANTFTWSIVTAPTGATLTPAGAFSWTALETDGGSTYPVTLRVTDTGVPPASADVSFSITVTEDNQTPWALPIADLTINESVPYAFTAAATDADIPANNLFWSLQSGPGFILPNGNYSWTPTEAQGPGSYLVTLRVTDDGAGNLWDEESFTITVDEVNLAPTLDPVGNQSVDELTALAFTATASDPDSPANGLLFSLSGAPSGATISPAGVFSWTPTEAQGPGSYVFDVVVTDDGIPSRNDSETITVTVGEVNLAPVLDPVGDRSIAETTPLSFTATASDPDDPANTLVFSLTGAPSGASITAGGAFSWTPTEAQGPGSYVFDVVVTETDGLPTDLSDSETITVTVAEGNLAPVLDPVGDRNIDELVNLSFTATASDPDDPANTLAFSLVGAPAGASITAGGVFSWTPTEVQGPGSFVFDVVVTETDGSPTNLSDSETITVSVGEVNAPPVADPMADQLIDEMTLLGVTATAGDVDQPANTLIWTLDSGPGSVLPNGAYSWTPTEAQGPGVYTVTLRVTDDGTPNLSDTVSFDVTVGEVNTAPVADAIVDRTVDELSVLSLTATGSDADVPANTLTWSLVSGPGFVLPNGDYSWTPTEAQGPGTYTVTLRVSDDGTPSLSDTVSFDVTVNEVNVAPVLDAVGNQSVDELVNLSFTASASDPDDPANLLSFSLSGAPSGASITSGGVFSWTPTEAQGPGSFVFDVVVTETNGSPSNLSDSESITVTVGEVNVAPVLNFVGNRAVDELVNLSFTATASDPDDPANTLTFSLVGAPAGASISPAGVFSWTPTEAQGPGVFSFDVVVTETNGSPSNLSDSETITVTVGEDNLAPTLNPVGNQTINELVNLSFTATASDPDAPVNTLLFSLAGEPAGAIIDPNTGAFSWTPTEAQGPGSYVFDVIVADDGAPGLNDSETITVTVNEVNLAPTLDPVGDRSVDELTALSFTATASDPDDPANTLTFSLSGAPSGASITAGGVFSWTPTEAQGPGSYVFDVVVTETNGSPINLSDTETITITINEVNLAPSATPIADVTMDERTLLSLTAAAIDPDIPANTLAWSVDAGPGVVLPTGEYSWFPTEADGPGVYPVTLGVTDDGVPSQTGSVSFTVTVDEVNSPPVVLASAYTVDEGGILAPGPAGGVLAGAFDAEGDPVSAVLDTGPAFGSLTLLADGSFVYEHDGSENFVDGFTFRAADGLDMSEPIAVTMTVNPLNDVPVMTGATFAADEGTAVGTALGAPVASDADGDSLVFAFVSPDPTFAIDSLTGTISLAGVLDFETVPSFTLDVSATDPSGASAVAPVVITVGDVDEVPVAAPAAFPVVESLPVGSTLGAMTGSDPEGEPVSFSLVGGDPAGQFTIDPTTGELILVEALDADTTPSYVLSIVVTDPAGNATSTSAIVLVSPAALLPPVNASPLGLPDLLSLDEDSFAILAPLVNDTDPDGDPLFVTWIDSPINGTLTANGDGTYTYRPDPDFNGSETLAYGISDGRGGLDTAEVVLAILAVNDPPIAPSVEATLEFVPVLEIPIPRGIFDPEGDPVAISVGTPGSGTVTLTDGIFTYIPPPEWNGVDTFSYVVTDSGGSSSSGVVTVRVSQIDGGLVALDLVSVEEVAPPPAVPSSGIVVDSIKLLVGTVAEMAGLLGIPLLAVGVAFLASILFGFSRNFLIGRGPVFLPATGPGTVGIVRVPAGAIVTALEGPGEEYPLVYRYQPAESGIRATGRQAQRGSTRWVEVETPEGDGWVIGRFVTATVPAGTFAEDPNVGATIEAIRQTIADRSDVSPLVTSHGLEIAYYAPSKHFAGDELAGLVAGDSSWGWWDPTGSVPSVRGDFATIVADPLAKALATLEGRAVAEAVVEIPVEFVNFPSLTFSEPDHLGWRVFFEYEDEAPKLAAIWREGVTNPASL